MTGKEFNYIKETVENEGFDYAFANYTDFSEIKDEEFHRLRAKFLLARTNLIEYCGLDF